MLATAAVFVLIPISPDKTPHNTVAMSWHILMDSNLIKANKTERPAHLAKYFIQKRLDLYARNINNLLE